MTDAGSNHWQRLSAALGAPRDIAAVVAFRIAIGAIVVISSLRFLSYGWIDELYNKPGFHLRYWGFAWVPLPSPVVTTALFTATGVLGLLVALGLCYRPAVALLFFAFTYLQLVDVATYLNHYYLVSLFAALLVFIPAHRAASLDARLRPAIRAATLPAWCTYLLRFQVAVVYVNAGLAKATTDWLVHAQPLNIWLSARTGLPVVGPYLNLPGVAHVAAWTGFVFDTTIVMFLLWRRTRAVAYLVVLGFHAATHFLFPPIGMFPVIMVVAATVFFDASWPRRWLPAVAPPSAAAASAGGVTRARGLRVAAAAAGVYILVQILLPLRAHLYGGSVLWHEQGMRFSWRVMARAKNGSVTFIVSDPRDGRQWHVSPAKYLTPIQEREMAVQPDLILQLAHHIAREFEAAGRPGVEVRADARASLNGRPAAVLIDPATDLAREQDGIGRKRWILPAPDIAPLHLRRARYRTL